MLWNICAVAGLLATSIATIWWLLPLGDSGLFWSGSVSERDSWFDDDPTDVCSFIDLGGDCSTETGVSCD